MKTLRNASVLVVYAVCAGMATTAIEYSTLSLIVRPVEYSPFVYAAPPLAPSLYVFFVGEPIRLELAVFNQGTDPLTLRLAADNPESSFVFRSRRETTDVNLPILVDASIQKQTPTFRATVPFEKELFLLPREAVGWTAEVQTSALAPGRYWLDLDVLATDDAGRPIRPVGSRFPFEVRARTSDLLLDITLRAAVKASFRGQYDEADAQCVAALAIHPQSVGAYSERGAIAAAQGRKEDAVRYYTQALTLLESGADKLFLRWASSSVVSDSISALRASLEANQR